jgi:hypothetical protein
LQESQKRSQKLTSGFDDKIIIDRETFTQIFSLLNRSADILSVSRYHEIFVHSLNAYLCESFSLNDSQIFKASLLLDAWISVVPDNLQQLAIHLEDARQLMSVISAVSQLGADNVNTMLDTALDKILDE